MDVDRGLVARDKVCTRASIEAWLRGTKYAHVHRVLTFATQEEPRSSNVVLPRQRGGAIGWLTLWCANRLLKGRRGLRGGGAYYLTLDVKIATYEVLVYIETYFLKYSWFIKVCNIVVDTNAPINVNANPPPPLYGAGSQISGDLNFFIHVHV